MGVFTNLHTTYSADGETMVATAKVVHEDRRRFTVDVWTLIYTTDGFELIVHPDGRHTRPGDEHESSPASRFYEFVSTGGF